MRNLLYFVIGVLLAVNASLAFAGWEPFTAPVNVPMHVSSTGQVIPKVGGQYSINGIRVAATTPDAITIKRTASIAVPAATAAGGKLIAQVGQHILIAKPAIVSALGLVVRGGPAIVASLAGSALLEYLLNKYEIKDGLFYGPYAAQVGTSTSVCSSSYPCFILDGRYSNDPIALVKENQSRTFSSGYSASGHTYKLNSNNQAEVWFTLHYPNGTTTLYTNRILSCVGNTCTGKPLPPASAPINNADIDKSAADFVATNPQGSIDELKGRGIPVPLSGVSNPPFEASPQSQESPASQPSTTQSTAADGTITRTDCTDSVIVSFSPEGTMSNTQIKRCTTTITLPDGTVKPGGTTITGQPVAPPTTGTGTETKPPEFTCDQFGNCDWVKESTVTGLMDWMRETPTVEGDTSNLDKTEQFDISSQLRLGQDDFFSGGQCPMPIQISVSGAVPLELELSYEPMCRFVLMVRPMLLALGALASLFIIFGRR